MKGHKQVIIDTVMQLRACCRLVQRQSFPHVPTCVTEQVGTCEVGNSSKESPSLHHNHLADICNVGFFLSLFFFFFCSSYGSHHLPWRHWMHDQKIQVALTCSVNLSWYVGGCISLLQMTAQGRGSKYYQVSAEPFEDPPPPCLGTCTGPLC